MRPSDVVPARRRLPDRLPEVAPPEGRARHEGVGDPEVPPRLRVVRAALSEVAVPSDRALDLGDDVGVVEDVVLVRRRRRQEAEDVVPSPGLRLGGRERREARVGDAIDLDGDVVPLTPPGRPRVQPRVVGGNDVLPLDDRERALQRPAGEAHRPRERGGHDAAADDQRRSADPRPAQELRPCQAALAPHVALLLRRHRHATGGVVVSAKTAKRGTATCSVPDASVFSRPTSRFRPVPSAFHSTSRKDVFGGSPPIVYGTSSGRRRPDHPAPGVETENGDVTCRRDVARQHLRGRRPGRADDVHDAPSAGLGGGRHELQEPVHGPGGPALGTGAEGRVILRPGVVLRRVQIPLDRAVEAELGGPDHEPGVLEGAERRLRHPRTVRPRARLEAVLALEGRNAAHPELRHEERPPLLGRNHAEDRPGPRLRAGGRSWRRPRTPSRCAPTMRRAGRPCCPRDR